MAYGILVPRSGIKPACPALEVQSLNLLAGKSLFTVILVGFFLKENR